VSPRRLTCVAALIVLGLLGHDMSAIALSSSVAAALAILAISEASWWGRRGAVG
jgi:hypothetical protein